jgi:DNA polymerase-3 subunit alpha (Gram-positive type)
MPWASRPAEAIYGECEVRVLIKPGREDFLGLLLSDLGETVPDAVSHGKIENIDLDIDESVMRLTVVFPSVVEKEVLLRVRKILGTAAGVSQVTMEAIFSGENKTRRDSAPVVVPGAADSASLLHHSADGDFLSAPSEGPPGEGQIPVPPLSGTGDCSIRSRDEQSVRSFLTDYWEDLISEIKTADPSFNGWLANCAWKIDDGQVLLTVNNELSVKELNSLNCNRALEDAIYRSVGVKPRVSIALCQEQQQKTREIIRTMEDSPVKKEFTPPPVSMAAPISGDKFSPGKPAARSFKDYSSRSGVRGGSKFPPVFSKAITGSPRSIGALNIGDQGKRVVVKGEIFSAEVKETKTGRIISVIKISDGTDSICVKTFFKKEEEEEVASLKEGKWVLVEGTFERDEFMRDDVVSARAMRIVEAPPGGPGRDDTAALKRVELHCHSSLSAMDGINTVGEMVKMASTWGQPAIAVTDHGVLQGYPDLASAAKKNGIKAIYGVEAYLINDMITVMTAGTAELEPTPLDEAVFVVFDLETTALNPVAGQIIEIGATRIRGSEVIDTFSQLIALDGPLPPEIVKLTGITEEMLQGQADEKSALEDFRKYIGNDVLVAHNAFNFDASFVRYRLQKHDLEPYGNPVLDTLPLSQAINHHLHSHALKTLVKHFGVNLENHHRAVDDAAATAEILRIFLRKLQDEKGIVCLTQIPDLCSEVDLKSLRPYHAVILVKNRTGLRNLYELVSEAHLKYFHKHPRIPKSEFSRLREGLILGSACEAGEVFQAIMSGRKAEEIDNLASFYDYLEIMPIINNRFLVDTNQVKSDEGLRAINKVILEIGQRLGKPVVATSDAHFVNPEDEIYRQILQAGMKFRDADKISGLYMKTTDEMLEEFSYLGAETAMEVVVRASQRIADSIEVLTPVPDGLYPPTMDGAEDEIREETFRKARELYGENLPDIVMARVERELDSIIGNGYAVLYLIARKLVQKSLSDGYLVGSRGSVGSSIVAFFAGITEVNALPPHYLCSKCGKSEFFDDGRAACGADLPDAKCPHCGEQYQKLGFDIPFEVFMGFKGDKVPDIDLNFSGKYQGRIHKYTEELFGADHVFRAGTISTVQERTAMGFVKGFYEDRGVKKRDAEICRLAKGCTGVRRTTGQHPGGLMVVPSDMSIYDFCPVQRPANKDDSDTTTTHFDYHSIHDNLVKLDLLGHDDPTVIRMLEDFTGVDAKAVPLDDSATLSLYTSPKALGVDLTPIGCETGTLGIPEFGTRFVRQMLKETRPTTFGELVLISGLSHGTNVWTNNAQEFVREGVATLKEVIAVRDDIMNYLIHKGLDKSLAFKVMEFVRKGKGAKEKEKMEEFAQEMSSHGVPDWYIESCRRISYMFPKAHAVAYVMMAFRIAWFKINYPAAYYATYFSTKGDAFDAELICAGRDRVFQRLKELTDMGNAATKLEKDEGTVLEVAYEMYSRGVKLLPVNLEESRADEFKIMDNALLPPFSSLRGLGAKVADNIVNVREERPFRSIEDLRVSCGVNKTVMEVLRQHGCLRGMPETAQLTLF